MKYVKDTGFLALFFVSLIGLLNSSWEMETSAPLPDSHQSLVRIEEAVHEYGPVWKEIPKGTFNPYESGVLVFRTRADQVWFLDLGKQHNGGVFYVLELQKDCRLEHPEDFTRCVARNRDADWASIKSFASEALTSEEYDRFVRQTPQFLRHFGITVE